MQPMEARLDSDGMGERMGLLAGMETAVEEPAGSLAEVAHDARNMVTALGLYCDLLQEPGVLAEPFRHYAGELELVTAASRRLMEKLAAMDAVLPPAGGALDELLERRRTQSEARPLGQPAPMENLARQLHALRNLLAALAGQGVELTISAEGGARPVAMSAEGLTRVLVNLVKNASEAMPQGGHIHIQLKESEPGPDGVAWLTLTVEDNGRGIAPMALEHLFEAGYTTRARPGSHAAHRRGLGLAIARSLVKAAGGRMQAANRDPSGACIQMELPVEKQGPGTRD
jgi:signal transduction histidine kinase